ncbi:MAG: DUF1073 domain-containing protein [Clostridia bacterium]|nr:DUF1073 domain-containing protein [Clostridia bacterium]
MSRPYKKKKPTGSRAANLAKGQNAAPAPSVLAQAAMLADPARSASDGFANPTAFLGESSPLMSSGTFFRRGLTGNMELLTTAYRENWIAKRIIDMPSEDMTRQWYKLTTSLPDEDIRDLRRLEAKHSIRREITNAIRWARLYGGSLAVIVVRNVGDSPFRSGRTRNEKNLSASMVR